MEYVATPLLPMSCSGFELTENESGGSALKRIKEFTYAIIGGEKETPNTSVYH